MSSVFASFTGIDNYIPEIYQFWGIMTRLVFHVTVTQPLMTKSGKWRPFCENMLKRLVHFILDVILYLRIGLQNGHHAAIFSKQICVCDFQASTMCLIMY